MPTNHIITLCEDEAGPSPSNDEWEHISTDIAGCKLVSYVVIRIIIFYVPSWMLQQRQNTEETEVCHSAEVISQSALCAASAALASLNNFSLKCWTLFRIKCSV